MLGKAPAEDLSHIIPLSYEAEYGTSCSAVVWTLLVRTENGYTVHTLHSMPAASRQELGQSVLFGSSAPRFFAFIINFRPILRNHLWGIFPSLICATRREISVLVLTIVRG